MADFASKTRLYGVARGFKGRYYEPTGQAAVSSRDLRSSEWWYSGCVSNAAIASSSTGHSCRSTMLDDYRDLRLFESVIMTNCMRKINNELISNYREKPIEEKLKEDFAPYLFEVARRGSGEGELMFPRCVACCLNGDIVVADSENNRLQIYNGYGIWKDTISGPYLKQPTLVAMSASTLAPTIGAVADRSHVVHLVDIERCRLVSQIQVGYSPSAIAWTTTGYLLCALPTTTTTTTLSSSGKMTTTTANKKLLTSSTMMATINTNNESRDGATASATTNNKSSTTGSSNKIIIEVFGGQLLTMTTTTTKSPTPFINNPSTEPGIINNSSSSSSSSIRSSSSSSMRMSPLTRQNTTVATVAASTAIPSANANANNNSSNFVHQQQQPQRLRIAVDAPFPTKRRRPLQPILQPCFSDGYCFMLGVRSNETIVCVDIKTRKVRSRCQLKAPFDGLAIDMADFSMDPQRPECLLVADQFNRFLLSAQWPININNNNNSRSETIVPTQVVARPRDGIGQVRRCAVSPSGHAISCEYGQDLESSEEIAKSRDKTTMSAHRLTVFRYRKCRCHDWQPAKQHKMDATALTPPDSSSSSSLGSTHLVRRSVPVWQRQMIDESETRFLDRERPITPDPRSPTPIDEPAVERTKSSLMMLEHDDAGGTAGEGEGADYYADYYNNADGDFREATMLTTTEGGGGDELTTATTLTSATGAATGADYNGGNEQQQQHQGSSSRMVTSISMASSAAAEAVAASAGHLRTAEPSAAATATVIVEHPHEEEQQPLSVVAAEPSSNNNSNFNNIKTIIIIDPPSLHPVNNNNNNTITISKTPPTTPAATLMRFETIVETLPSVPTLETAATTATTPPQSSSNNNNNNNNSPTVMIMTTTTTTAIIAQPANNNVNSNSR